MLATRVGMVLLSGVFVLLGGCACCSYCTQVSNYFMGVNAGEVQLQAGVSPQEAQVMLQTSLTQAGWDVKVNSSPGNDRFVLDGKTKSGKPFKVVLFSADNGRGEQLVKAKLEVTGGDLVEVRAMLPVAPTASAGPTNRK